MNMRQTRSTTYNDTIERRCLELGSEAEQLIDRICELVNTLHNFTYIYDVNQLYIPTRIGHEIDNCRIMSNNRDTYKSKTIHELNQDITYFESMLANCKNRVESDIELMNNNLIKLKILLNSN